MSRLCSFRCGIVRVRSRIVLLGQLRWNTSTVPSTRKTGVVFRTQLPILHQLDVYYSVASKVLITIEKDENIKNLRRRHRKYAAQSLDTLMKSLIKPLTEVLVQYPKVFRNLHPFEVNERMCFGVLCVIIAGNSRRAYCYLKS